MELGESLDAWDGKSASEIGAVYERYAEFDDLPGLLLEMMQTPSRQVAATWLLKHGLEAGHVLNQDQTADLLNHLSSLTQWEAILHILQCLPFLEIPTEATDNLKSALEREMKSKRPFIRAWAYGGAATLANQYPDYRSWSDPLCAQALIQEAPSVKARLRQLNLR